MVVSSQRSSSESSGTSSVVEMFLAAKTTSVLGLAFEEDRSLEERACLVSLPVAILDFIWAAPSTERSPTKRLTIARVIFAFFDILVSRPSARQTLQTLNPTLSRRGAETPYSYPIYLSCVHQSSRITLSEQTN